MTNSQENPIVAIEHAESGRQRYFLKCVVTYVFFLVTWPLSIPSFICYRAFGHEGLFDFSAKFLSLIPGRIGQYLRASFYLVTLRKCYCDLAVGFGSFFSHPGASVGRQVGVGAYSIIGTVDIDPHVLIGSRVSITSGKYQHGSAFRRASDKHRRGPLRYDRIHIGRECWIGEGAVIMASIGAHSVVSAGSVVTKPAPENCLIVGNPARFVKIGAFNDE